MFCVNKNSFNVFFPDWCNDRGVDKKLPELSNVGLDQVLRRFYAEAQTKDGELYSRSSLLAIRNAIERFLNQPPHSRSMKITKGVEEAERVNANSVLTALCSN